MSNRNAYRHPHYKQAKAQVRKAKLGMAPRIPCALRLEGCLHEADTIDHKRPLARGGAWTADNLQPACTPCNKRKGSGRKKKQKSKKLFQNRG